MRNWLLLHPLRSGEDLALLALRLATGAFLVYGVWDNITSSARMQEFVGFLTQNGFAAPAFMARLSVWAQFLVGVAFLLGALVRWAGVICTINFIVALGMVHWQQDLRGWWPALALAVIGALLATRGGGRFSIDRWLGDEQATTSRV